MSSDEPPLFDPPLYLLRMSRVADLLQASGATSVLDFGCGEGKLLTFLRTSPAYSVLKGVDVDLPTVRKAVVQLQPLLMDHLQPRVRPMRVELCHGSVGCVDPCILASGPVGALASVEVIEHLDPPVLAQFRETVFRHYRPQTVVLTTPNADFNVFFPELARQGRFRHPDHRFEWTRAQFQAWCDAIAAEFGYGVRYEGIGLHPSGDTAPGACSQLAHFVRQSSLSPSTQTPTPTGPAPTPEDEWPLGSHTPYRLVAAIEYPHVTDAAVSVQAIVWAALGRRHEDAQEEGQEGGVRLRLADLWEGNDKVRELCGGSYDQLVALVQRHDVRMPIELDIGEGTVQMGALPAYADSDDQEEEEEEEADSYVFNIDSTATAELW